MSNPSEVFAFRSYSKKRTTIGTGGFNLGYGAMRARTSMAHTSGTTDEHSHRMLKKFGLLTRPTPASTSPPALSLPRQPLRPGTRLGPVKAAASNQRWFFQSCSCTLPRMARMSPPLRTTFSPAHPLADIFHPPYPPIASQSISRDVPYAHARAFRFSPLYPQGSTVWRLPLRRSGEDEGLVLPGLFT